MIVLVARCREGFGQKVFEEWMTGMGRPQVLIDRIQQEFVLGGHKAAAVAGLLARADVYLVSEFPDDVVRSMCMTPFATVDDAVSAALAAPAPAPAASWCRTAAGSPRAPPPVPRPLPPEARRPAPASCAAGR